MGKAVLLVLMGKKRSTNFSNGRSTSIAQFSTLVKRVGRAQREATGHTGRGNHFDVRRSAGRLFSIVGRTFAVLKIRSSKGIALRNDEPFRVRSTRKRCESANSVVQQRDFLRLRPWKSSRIASRDRRRSTLDATLKSMSA